MLFFLQDLIKDNFPALQHLDLSNNFLKTFPAAKLYGVVNLQTLFIENNRITNLNMSDLKRMEFYKRLKLGGESNLYHCDCDSPSDIQIWLHDQDNRGKVSPGTVCFLIFLTTQTSVPLLSKEQPHFVDEHDDIVSLLSYSCKIVSHYVNFVITVLLL